MTEPEEVVLSKDEAILEIAKEVVVDFEVVEFRAVKFWNVEEAVVRRLVKFAWPFTSRATAGFVVPIPNFWSAVKTDANAPLVL